jgi:hypothetical protein
VNYVLSRARIPPWEPLTRVGKRGLILGKR